MSRPRLAGLAVAAGIVVAVSLTLVTRPASACACGIAIDASVSEESGLVIEEPGQERIVLSLDLTSDGPERAAVVLPVPATPTVEAVRGGDPLAYLERATAAPVVGSAGDGATAAGAGGGVEVIGRENVGGYDVARLGAADGAALDRWLDQNGYTLPDGAQPILDDYVDEGWRFVAIRLAPKADGPLRPLEVGFPAQDYVYPMRLEQLATGPFDLTLYTLADGPRTVNGLDIAWSGDTSELSPPPPARLSSIFGDGGYVTRLEANGADPSTFTTDLAVAPAVATVSTDDQTTPSAEPEDSGGISTVALIAIILAGLAFAAGLVLLTRPREG